MRKSKTKLIVVIMIILVVAIAAVSIGAYVFLATDLFKSDQQLFFKYLAKNGEVIEAFIKSEDENTVNQDKYTSNSEITFNLESNDSQIANQTIPVSNFKVKSIAKADPKNNRESRETTLKFSNKDLFTLKYLRNDDLYALASDEVVNKYLAIDNNNLKEFATKLGITDTSLIPDKIPQIDIKELLSINDEAKKEILGKYLKVINDQVPSEKYTSKKDVVIVVDNSNVTTTSYSLELTEKEAIDLLSIVLNTLKEDESTLNIILEKVKTIDNRYADVDDIKDVLQDVINDINSIQITETKTIRITVYENNGELIRTEIAVGEDVIDIDTKKDDALERAIVTINMQNSDFIENDIPTIERIEILNQKADGQNTSTITATLKKSEDIIKVSIQSKTTIEGENIKNNSLININMSDTTYITAKVDTVTTPDDTVEVDELTKENSATINNFTPLYIIKLTGQIKDKLNSLYNTKLDIINNVQQETQVLQQLEQDKQIINNTNNAMQQFDQDKQTELNEINKANNAIKNIYNNLVGNNIISNTII